MKKILEKIGAVVEIEGRDYTVISTTLAKIDERVGCSIYSETIFNAVNDWVVLPNAIDSVIGYEDVEEDEEEKIYQYYIIPSDGAFYLQHFTGEIVLYSEKLDMFLWGVTTWGVSWEDACTSALEWCS